jgi:hypothetical protein
MAGIFDFLKKDKEEDRIIPQVKLQEIKQEEKKLQEKEEEEKEIKDVKKLIQSKEKKPAKPMVKDPGKRHRLFLLAIVIVGLVFGLKIWRKETWEFEQGLWVALGASILTYVGLILSFGFRVSKKSLIAVLPQAALFVFGAVLFLVMFFFGEFERIYESLIFILFLLGFTGLIGLVFSTANILSVSTVKKIPLFRAGQTASYAIVLLTVFFITFTFISSGLSIFGLIPLLGGFYFISTWFHLSHFETEEKSIIWYCVGVSWAALLALLAFLFWPVSGLLISFVPVTIMYFGLGIVMYHLGKSPIVKVVWEFAVFVLIALIFIMFQAKWGIGGGFWM